MVELVQSGAIGGVREVHAYGPGRNMETSGYPETDAPIPKDLDYDLWLGPLAYRPFRKSTRHFIGAIFGNSGGGTLSISGVTMPIWRIGRWI